MRTYLLFSKQCQTSTLEKKLIKAHKKRILPKLWHNFVIIDQNSLHRLYISALHVILIKKIYIIKAKNCKRITNCKHMTRTP